ncbi:MAG TPA: nicotinamide mononucleotide transporter [Candidatus Fimiplasma intestinipullorum]|uniref:Nicotinamide mononucleotide transporter n=1 Tax=Candidatus Fimiplasma intestinipullorum TaxID=2840825 RepID=A0A9D1HP72_9FIRM|nr:nicotinamide mononucleotide transporter [Candidatus Fimiplasma intestinipullorum]
MIQFFKANMEPRKRLRMVELGIAIVLCIASVVSIGYGLFDVYGSVGNIQFVQSLEMTRDEEMEDYSEDNTICDVTYRNGDAELVVSYSYDDYMNLEEDTITAYEYENDQGMKLYFNHQDVTDAEIQYSYQQTRANELTSLFNFGMASFILMISVLIMTLFARQFTTYEKGWFLSIMVLATIISVLFPEESANGVNGIVIMLLYLLDTFLNILCELLISKQSRYNFLVSVLVEIVEIAMCIVLMYRFATMATTLFFWLPIDIISYINWSRHKDDQEDELTVVRRLKGYQEVLVIVGIVVWTVVVGYFISGLDIATDFINNQTLETAIIYIDACASAVGIANGLFIFFRLREQWIAWYICAFLEMIINIVSGQYVLLPLKLGYFTNTTYGYIKWTKYIQSHSKEKQAQIS